MPIGGEIYLACYLSVRGGVDMVIKRKDKDYFHEKRDLVAATVEQKPEMDVNLLIKNNEKVTVKSVDFSIREDKDSVMI